MAGPGGFIAHSGDLQEGQKTAWTVRFHDERAMERALVLVCGVSCADHCGGRGRDGARGKTRARESRERDERDYQIYGYV